VFAEALRVRLTHEETTSNNVAHEQVILYHLCSQTGGVVALSVQYRIRHQEVVGSSLGRARGVKTLDMFLTPLCLVHQAVQFDTSQRAVMPCGWGVKAGMVCVWVAAKTV